MNLIRKIAEKLVSPFVWIWDRPWPRWWYNTRTFPRECVRGVRSLIAWFPIIWRDRDWDWEFLNNILIFKLSRMEKQLRDGWAEDGHLYADEIAEVIDNLRQLPDDLPPERKDGRPRTKNEYIIWEKKLRAHQSRAFYIMGTKMRHWWD